MEILKLDLSRLRNEEHYNFHSEVNTLVQRFTAEALGIQSKYPVYGAAFAAEGEVLDVVRKAFLPALLPMPTSGAIRSKPELNGPSTALCCILVRKFARLRVALKL